LAIVVEGDQNVEKPSIHEELPDVNICAICPDGILLFPAAP